MNKLALTLSLIAISVVLCNAGPERYADKKQVIPTAPCEWYRAGEWELDLWGAYVFSEEQGSDEFDINNFDYVAADREFDRTERPLFLGDFGDHNNILGRDN